MEESLAMKKHREWAGKLEIQNRCPVTCKEELSVAYTPGVAEPCLAIQADEKLSYELTRRWNTVAVITNGTAVLGLGDIGPVAGMPVMEGKAVLFKAFGNIDAIPLCVNSKDVDAVVETVALLEGSFGGVNLEDIASPACFEIEKKLKERCKIPIFHDDQHGTAVVVLAAIKNALKLAGKKMEDIKIVINGCGAAGIAIAKLLNESGAGNILMCDRKGIVSGKRKDLNAAKLMALEFTNKNNEGGKLKTAMKKADVFVGVSGPKTVSAEEIKVMAEKPIIFAMANPVPEIMPEDAYNAGAYIVGTGRSDYANQINNVLAFPGIFRGALDARATEINEAMKLAAAEAIANLVSEEELATDYIIPSPFDERVAKAVAENVKKVAIETGVAGI